jgi:hypothetical protein
MVDNLRMSLIEMVKLYLRNFKPMKSEAHDLRAEEAGFSEEEIFISA